MNLNEIGNVLLDAYENIIGSGFHHLLFFLTILWIFLKKEEKKIREVWGYYFLLWLALCAFPPTAWVINACIKGSYWRVLWMLPVPFIMAYAAASFTEKREKKAEKIACVLGIAVLIVLTGRAVLSPLFFTERENWVKLDEEAINTCGALERDAAGRGIEQIRLACAADMICQIRQYDANIWMPYGRSPMKKETIGETEQALFDALEADVKDYREMDRLIRKLGCNYFLYYMEEGSRSVFESLGYEMICIEDYHYLYLVPQEAKSLEAPVKEADLAAGEYAVTCYPSYYGSQAMFFTIQDSEGHLMVIDGGWNVDAPFVRQTIESLGGVVDCWIVTHGHPDHADAFLSIYNDPGDIIIRQIYTNSLTYDQIEEPLSWEKYGTLQALDQALEGDERRQVLHTGDTFTWQGLQIEVLSSYEPGMEKLTKDLLNDGSVMFKVTGQTESMLFCADVGENLSDTIREVYAEKLPCDYIQMGHHGNGGLKEDFYRLTNAREAFFCAPGWLVDNRDPETAEPAAYRTPERLLWMQSMGCETVDFRNGVVSVVLH